MLWLAIHFWLYGPAGFRDETLAAYADPAAVYHLVEWDGAPVREPVTLVFPGMWKMTIEAPCFRHEAKILVPYPWFDLSKGEAVEFGCANTSLQIVLTQAFYQMSLAEVLGPVLILTDDDGGEMVFRTQS